MVARGVHDAEFKVAEFAVGHDDEVAASAGGVHVADVAELFQRSLSSGVGPYLERQDVLELRAQFVEEQRVQRLEDVLLGCVVLAEFTSGLRISHGLEHRAEDGGADGGPVDRSAASTASRKSALSVGKLMLFVEDAAVDVWEVASSCGSPSRLAGEVSRCLNSSLRRSAMSEPSRAVWSLTKSWKVREVSRALHISVSSPNRGTGPGRG